jgi:cytoskeletal protein CcmA (bactofilin family)
MGHWFIYRQAGSMASPHLDMVAITMFGRSKNVPAATPVKEPVLPPTPSISANPVTARSVAMIGPSITIKGEVTGEEDLLIHGKVEGTINLSGNQLSIGESGQVCADIKAKIVKIDGKVTGDITGIEKVVISKSGNVKGNIIAPRVTLEDGAVFKGSIDMDPAGAATAKAQLASQPPTHAVATPLKASGGLDLKSV